MVLGGFRSFHVLVTTNIHVFNIVGRIAKAESEQNFVIKSLFFFPFLCLLTCWHERWSRRRN